MVFKFFKSISLQNLAECLERNTEPVVEVGFEPSSGCYLKERMNDRLIPLQIYVGGGVWEYTWNDFPGFDIFIMEKRICDLSQNGRLHLKSQGII